MNVETRLIFDKDMDNHKVGRFLTHSVYTVCIYNAVYSLLSSAVRCASK